MSSRAYVRRRPSANGPLTPRRTSSRQAPSGRRRRTTRAVPHPDRWGRLRVTFDPLCEEADTPRPGPPPPRGPSIVPRGPPPLPRGGPGFRPGPPPPNAFGPIRPGPPVPRPIVAPRPRLEGGGTQRARCQLDTTTDGSSPERVLRVARIYQAFRGFSSSKTPSVPTRASPEPRPLNASNRSNVPGWQCPLCSKRNDASDPKCGCCGRARELAASAADRLWAGPKARAADPPLRSRPAPPSRQATTGYDAQGTVAALDAGEKQRRLEYYRRRPPPKRPRGPTPRAPRRPPGPPPSHAVSSSSSSNQAHAVETKHFTSRFHDKEEHEPLRLKENDRRLHKSLATERKGARLGVPDGVVLSELCSLGGCPCAVTVVQREWRAIVHAVDLERGDEYSASTELHARYVDAAAPTDAEKLSLYRELVAACTFKSTLAANNNRGGDPSSSSSEKVQRRLVVNAPTSEDSQLAKFSKARANDERQTRARNDAKTRRATFLVLADERLLLGEVLTHVEATVRDPPAIVEVQLEDPTTHLKSSLSFPLGAAFGLATALQGNRHASSKDNHARRPRVVPVVGYAFIAHDNNTPHGPSASMTPWASSAAKRAPSKLHAARKKTKKKKKTNADDSSRITTTAAEIRVLEPEAYRIRIAMAVEFVCSELTSSVVEENLQKVLRVTPSASLVAAIADACRHNRAAVIAQAAWRRFAAIKRFRTRSREQGAVDAVAASRVQSFLRCRVERRKFERRLAARETIRREWRRHKRRTRRRHAAAATQIATTYRVYMAQKRVRLARARVEDARAARRVVAIAMAKERERQREVARLAKERQVRAVVELQQWAREQIERRRMIGEARCELSKLRRSKAGSKLARVSRGMLGRRRARHIRASRVAAQLAEQHRLESVATCRIQSSWRRRRAAKTAACLRHERARHIAASRIASEWKHSVERREARETLEDRRTDLLLRAAQAAESASEADVKRHEHDMAERSRRMAHQERVVAAVRAERAAVNAAAAAKRAAVMAVRAARSSRDAHQSRAATTIVSAFYRAHRKRAATVRFAQRAMAAVRIQSMCRETLARRVVVSKRQRNAAAGLLQHAFRGWLARSSYAELLASRWLAATRIQARVRQLAARQLVRAILSERRERSATRIQTTWRRVLARLYVSAVRSEMQAAADRARTEAWREWAATVIQVRWREIVARKAAENEAAWREWAVAVLQAWWRERLAALREPPIDTRRPTMPINTAGDDEDEDESDDDDEPFDFNPQDRHDVHEAFQWARHGRRDKLRKFCEGGFDVDLRNEFNQTLAMVAAQNNRKGVLKLLYRWGVSINDVDWKGNTALHYACKYGTT
ncbi:hypothetical protein CTAYLR_006695 [Chrysophaeum taylorii]|uniref:RanBP2-type domain-containing protein n=1 Tax=Chrysophaeum taylorii TaxID=2483200 RepID=A0AAD7UDS0_9STRA|nr:hypothetical protein CTAYLR_006695 [Chrysophaeum taylorii]